MHIHTHTHKTDTSQIILPPPQPLTKIAALINKLTHKQNNTHDTLTHILHITDRTHDTLRITLYIIHYMTLHFTNQQRIVDNKELRNVNTTSKNHNGISFIITF